MEPDRTELEWVYQPEDFFGTVHSHNGSTWSILIQNGCAVSTLRTVQDPIDPEVEKEISEYLQAICLVRTLQVHRDCNLSGPRVNQHSEGRKRVSIAFPVTVGVSVNFSLVQSDATGAVLRDVRAKSIAENAAMMNSLVPVLRRFPVLRSLLESYRRAVSDPANELVHLYEIRDALSKHVGTRSALVSLGASASEWSRLGSLANDEPLNQGRHRGKHVQDLRDATKSELEEARSIARKLILAYAKML